MRKSDWTRRDPIKNYFPLPNEIYSLGLSAGAGLIPLPGPPAAFLNQHMGKGRV